MKFLFFFTLLFLPNTSFAYLDPGTGGGIIQALLAFFGAIAFYISYPFIITKKYFRKLKEKIFKKKNEFDQK